MRPQIVLAPIEDGERVEGDWLKEKGERRKTEEKTLKAG
jgi:hypothetical protein